MLPGKLPEPSEQRLVIDRDCSLGRENGRSFP